MSKYEKLLEKLLSLPKNFTYDEMVKLLKGFGYIHQERKRSSGSAVMFYNKKLNDKIMFHKPHPEKELKEYILKLVIQQLKNNKLV
jgi:predicted RNA binding protein YcfA (HicA-like mRNA interferase family)